MSPEDTNRGGELARRSFAALIAIVLLWGISLAVTYYVAFTVGGFMGSRGADMDFGYITRVMATFTTVQMVGVALLLHHSPWANPRRALAWVMLLQGILLTCLGSLMLPRINLARDCGIILAAASFVASGFCFQDEKGSKWLRLSSLWPIPLLAFVMMQFLAVIKPEEAMEFAANKAKAERGDSNAQLRLAACYESGYGVAQDQAEALRWYRKAASKGNSDAEILADILEEKMKSQLTAPKAGK